jgi:Fe2+ or Zn2+ uptake regulation protein
MTDELHTAVAARLRAVGHRYSPRRRSLVEALAAARNPVAVPYLTATVEAFPQSSAYRNLAVLERAGAVRRVPSEDGFARYELAEDLTQHHHHLVCRTCGAVEDVMVPPAFERQLERTLSEIEGRTGFSAVSHRLDFIGTCRACSYGVR